MGQKDFYLSLITVEKESEEVKNIAHFIYKNLRRTTRFSNIEFPRISLNKGWCKLSLTSDPHELIILCSNVLILSQGVCK